MTNQEKQFHAACAACAAMQGILAWEKGAWKSGDIAEMACNYADALIARLAETEPKELPEFSIGFNEQGKVVSIGDPRGRIMGEGEKTWRYFREVK